MEDAQLHELVKELKKLYRELGRVPTRDEFMIHGASDYGLRMAGGFVKLKFLAGLVDIDEEEDPELTDYIPKILILDIETSLMTAYTFGIGDVHLTDEDVIDDWYIMCYSAKWLGEKEVLYSDCKNSLGNDKKLCKELWALMDEADVIIGQNHVKFDLKKINDRLEFHKIGPPSPYRTLDTLQINRKNFSPTSRKLSYQSKRNEKYKKLDHGKYPGKKLWIEAMSGNKDAWKEMEKYNKYDVLATEEYYKRISKWDNSINWSIFSKLGGFKKCICGSTDLIKRGFRWANTGKFQMYLCNSCGKYHVDKTNVLSKNKRDESRKMFG